MNYGKSKKNKTKILFIAAALALVVTTAVFLVCFTGDNKGYRTISVVDIAGTVSVVKDGIEYSAYPGMILQEGHEIVTAANSYVRLVLDDDKYVKLESGSRLVFETLGLIGSNKTQMNLERGALTSEIVKPLESDAQYVVVAPNAVLSVRGTFFRLDLGVAENGEITADVMTYGGQVASQRIMPTGEVIEEEVLIDAGFKTSINMDTDNTVYVMQTVDGAVDTTGDGVANLAPIVVTDIPDDDMVDIYFAAENGHELFVSAEEVKVDIEDRGIDLEAQTSVYELAEAIKEETEETSAVTLAGTEVFADDSKPIARVEETEEESEVTGEVSSEKPTTTVVSVLTDGDGLAKEEVHVHTYTKEETLAATCEATGVNTYTCACGENYTEEIPAIGHTSVNGGTASAHVKCDSCGEILNGSTAHLYVQEVTTEPTCTTTGIRTYSCSCGHVYTEEIAALGHSEVAGNASDCHSQCFVCKEILVDGSGHVYSGSVTTAATCTTAGVRTFTCSCGHSYTESIAANGHSATTGGTESCHSKCSVCQATISDGSAHTFTITETDATCTQAGKTTYSCACGYSYTKEGEVLAHTYTSEITTEATCTAAGVKTFTCACGDSYTEEIPATGHSETTGGTENCHSKCSVCQVTITDGSAHTFTTSTTEATCTTAGATTYICDCGYSYVKETEAMGHTEVDGGTADCHSKCDVCGEVISTTHSYGDPVVTDATCTADGKEVYSCGCGYSYEEAIPATGHTEVAGATETCHSKCDVCQATIEDGSGHEFASEITTVATCTTAGVETYSCACGYSYTKEIEATGHTEVDGGTADCHSKCEVCGEVISTTHSYGDPVVTDATCTADGKEVYSCGCGYSYEEAIPATGHTEVAGATETCHSKCDVCQATIEDGSGHEFASEITTVATCTTAGVETYSCACGYSYTKEIEATGHTEVDGGTADCHSKCDVCGDVISTTHSYGAPVVTDATCTADGKEVYSCECGYSYEETISATGHTEVAGATETCHSKCDVCQATIEDGSGHEFASEITTVATCTTAGVETYSCACGYSYTKEIEATGHTEVDGGTADCHSKCDVCGDVISTTHSYGAPVVTDATCTADGKEVYSCECGYSYEETISATGHTEVNGGTADCHTKCEVCGEVLGTTHTYTETREEASCTEAGLITHTCDCGYVYTEEIEATGHTEVAGATADCHSKCEICGEVISTTHTYTDSTKAATCTEAGFVNHVCDCGYEYTEEIAATGHTEVIVGEADCHSKCEVCGEVISSTHTYTDTREEASCTEAGLITHTCACGYSYTEEIPATGHTEVVGGTEDCHSKCDVCGDVLDTTHTYTDTREEASCTEAGLITHACDCGYSYTEEIPATGHTEVAGATETCHSKCDVCQATIEDGSGHEFTSEITTAASCTTAGVETYSCACGYSYTKEIVATGHTEVVGGTADCHSKCEVCGEVISTTHSYGEPEVTGATCTVAGKEVYSCECGYSYEEVIPATGHTEVVGGTEDCHSKCDVCGDVLDTTHTYTDTREEASCTEAGLITHACDCGYVYTEEIAATGHTEVAGATETCHSKCDVCQATIEDGTSHTYESEITTAATCTTTGVETYSCACGYSYTKEIEATGHTEVAGATADCHSKCEVCGEVLGSTHTYTDTREEASCTEAGLITHTCACGYSYTEEIPATGHTEVAGATADCHSKCDVCQATIEDGSGHELTSEITTAATCTTTGVETYSCACGYSYTKEIEAIGHTKTDASASVTTCSSCGETLVDLSATNFPDATFLAYVEQFDTNGDGMLLGSELEAVTEIDVAGAGITDLTGIEHFTEITSLKCSSNSNLISVDVSALTKLETLNLTSCSSLSTLDVTALTELVTLEVNGTALTSLDTRNNTKLEVLRANNATGISTFCGETGTLNFSYNTSLKEIQFNSNTKFTAIDLTQNAALEKFIYNMMPMTTIDLTGCTSLSNFQIVSSGVTALDFSSCTNLTTMVATTCTELTSLNVSKCPITSLNIDRSTAISTLNVSGTKIASLDLSGRTALTTLTASSCTSLTSLNVSGCTLLKTINLASCTALSMDNVDLTGCSSLNSLNVDKCTKMTSLDFSMYDDLTALTSLTISNNSNLKTVDFSTLTALSSVSLANSGNMTNINISNTKLTGFDSSGMWSVVAFRAQNATKLTSISLGNASTLTTLDVTGCTALTSIDLNASSSLYSDTSQITGYTSSMGAIK